MVFSVKHEELSGLVENRNEGSANVLAAKYGGVKGLAEKLKVDVEKGINTGDKADLDARIEAFGSNKLQLKEAKSFFMLCYEALQDFTLLILIGCAVLNIVAGVLAQSEDHKGSWLEGVAILLTVGVVVCVSAGSDYAKEKQFQALNAMASDIKVNVTRDGKSVQISVYDLLCGDILWVNYGDLLAADGVLLATQDIKMDEAALTGEPILITKSVEEKPFMLSGTKVMEGSGKMLVVAVGKYSQAGIIKTLASGTETMISWLKLDGKAVVQAGQNVVELKGVPEIPPNLTHECKLRITGSTSEFNLKGKINRNRLTLDKPFDGSNSNDAVVEFSSSADDEGTSVLQKKLELLAGLIGKLGTLVAVVVTIVMITEHGVKMLNKGAKFDWYKVLDYVITGITILVVAVPEGLPLAVTLSLAFATKKMLSDNNLVKHLDACETMGSATTICSDKTGTLTTNRMTVMRGYYSSKFFDKQPADAPTSKTLQMFMECISLCSGKTTSVVDNPATPGYREYLGNKTECALLNMMMDMGHDCNRIRNNPAFNFPSGERLFTFTSAKKRMSIVIKLPEGGYRMYTKGASEIVLALCTSEISSTGELTTLTDALKEDINRKVIETFADEGYRTLALAFKDFKDEKIDWKEAIQDDYEVNMTLISIVGIEDPVREEVKGAIAQCNKAGITVRMVTGDNVRTAISIAKKCNILPKEDNKKFIVMEGPDFRKAVLDANGNLNQAEFDKIWPRLRVLARSSPKDKYTLVTGLINSELYLAKKKGELDGTPDYLYVRNDREVVAVTGDGTNDAPALSKADVGFAMGIQGTEVAKDSCDIVILDDNFTSIVKAVLWGRNIFASVCKFLQFQLVVNVVAISAAVIGGLANGESPLAAVQLLWVNLIMDSLGSLALATEPPTAVLLDRHPYGRNDPVLSPTMLKNIIVASVYQLAVVLTILFLGPKPFMPYSSQLDSNGQNVFDQCADVLNSEVQYERCVTYTHHTVLFNAFVFMTLANQINSRNLNDEINVFSGIFQNCYFVSIIAICAALQTLIVFFGGTFFKVAPLNGVQWGICIGLGVSMLFWGIIMHLIKPCEFGGKKKDTDASSPIVEGDPTSPTCSIIPGASDDIIRQISSTGAGIGARGQKRINSTRDFNGRSSSVVMPQKLEVTTTK